MTCPRCGAVGMDRVGKPREIRLDNEDGVQYAALTKRVYRCRTCQWSGEQVTGWLTGNAKLADRICDYIQDLAEAGELSIPTYE